MVIAICTKWPAQMFQVRANVKYGPMFQKMFQTPVNDNRKALVFCGWPPGPAHFLEHRAKVPFALARYSRQAGEACRCQQAIGPGANGRAKGRRPSPAPFAASAAAPQSQQKE